MAGNQRNQQPQPGDMIEFQRHIIHMEYMRWGINVGYTHWGIYVGNGQVVHFILPDWGQTFHQGVRELRLTATVRRDRLQEVVGNQPFQVNNEFDNVLDPLRPLDIVSRANRMVGMQLRYDLSRANCEHFASMMRYGIPQSQQVQAVLPMVTVDPNFESAIRGRVGNTAMRLRTVTRYSPPPRTVRRCPSPHDEL